MRTIKYRTWVKDARRWADHNEQLSEVDVSASVREPSVLSIGSDRYELCPFTGLHDKNGAEIYEGDIVSFITLENSDIPEKVGTVSFSDGSYRIYTGFSSHYRWINYVAEVIGNIYENPELLEASE